VTKEISRNLVGLGIGSPIRVKLVVLTVGRPLPVYPDKQTFSESVGMSQRCQVQTWPTSSVLAMFAGSAIAEDIVQTQAFEYSVVS